MRLAQWRKKEGKTQLWLAEKLGVSQPLISQFERAIDPVMPSRATLIRIAIVTRLKVLPNDFIPMDDVRRQVMADDANVDRAA